MDLYDGKRSMAQEEEAQLNWTGILEIPVKKAMEFELLFFDTFMNYRFTLSIAKSDLAFPSRLECSHEGTQTTLYR